MQIQVTTQFTDELFPSIEDAELAIAGFSGSKYKPLSKAHRLQIDHGQVVTRVFGNVVAETFQCGLATH